MKKISINVKKILPKSSFAKSVSVLAGGTAAGQFIVVAASPVLTRLYSPEDFGLLAVYGGILGILGVIASLRYELAIPLPEDNSKAASIAVLSLLAVIIMTLITGLAVAFFGSEIINILNTPSLQPYLWLVPLGVFLMGVYQVFQYWAIRTRTFSAIAKTRMSQSLGMVVVQVAGYTLGPLALLLGRVVGHGAGIFGLARSALKGHSRDFLSTTSTEVRQAAVEYRSFPIVSTWTGLASSAGLNLPPLLIAMFLGAGPAGLFSLAHRVLSQPMAVIGKAVSDAFYQKAAEANRKGELKTSIEKVYFILVSLALPPAISIFIIISDLFVFVFGEKWVVAGEIARWMTPWLFFQFVVSPCTGIYPIINRHDIALRFQVGLLVASVVGVVFGGAILGNLLWVVILISLLSSLVYLWRLVFTFSFIGGSGLTPVITLLKVVPISVAINTPLLLIYYLGNGSESWFLIFLGAGSFLIFWLLFCVKPVWEK